MFPMHRFRLIFLLFAVVLTFAACNRGATSQAEPAQAPIATTDPLLATPPPVLAEVPLQGQFAEIPNAFVVPARQSKSALATFLRTTPEQLDWVNPGLPDPVAPGTLVVIPSYYRTTGETMSEISQKTGMSEELLRAANAQIEDGEPLTTGTVLAVPVLYIVPEDMPLDSAAATLKTSNAALLSANPALAGQEHVAAGTVLVAPQPAEDR
jgi:LysM repeat protein